MATSGGDVPDRWCLLPIPFADGDPYVVGFFSREAAELFREQAGWAEDDWRAMPLRWSAAKHEPVCERCREPWPCTHARNEKLVRRAMYNLERTCPRCEKPVDNGQLAIVVATKAGRTWFHGRKGPCRTAAYRMAREHPDADIVREDTYNAQV